MCSSGIIIYNHLNLVYMIAVVRLVLSMSSNTCMCFLCLSALSYLEALWPLPATRANGTHGATRLPSGTQRLFPITTTRKNIRSVSKRLGTDKIQLPSTQTRRLETGTWRVLRCLSMRGSNRNPKERKVLGACCQWTCLLEIIFGSDTSEWHGTEIELVDWRNEMTNH